MELHEFLIARIENVFPVNFAFTSCRKSSMWPLYIYVYMKLFFYNFVWAFLMKNGISSNINQNICLHIKIYVEGPYRTLAQVATVM